MRHCLSSHFGSRCKRRVSAQVTFNQSEYTVHKERVIHNLELSDYYAQVFIF